MTPRHDPPPQHAEELVLEKLSGFSDVHVWPQTTKLNPYAWLDNFTPKERPYAIALLNAFLYFNEPMVDAMFSACVRSLGALVTAREDTFCDARKTWGQFLDNLYVTHVEGENPNPTDSGYIFARKARQVLGLTEEHILHPREAVQRINDTPHKNLLFVDDFVGSGNQITETWCRHYGATGAPSVCFAELAKEQKGRYFYTPLVCTAKGFENATRGCPGLNIHPAHLIDERYNLLNPRCVFWPQALRSTAVAVLFEASRRAGIVKHYKYSWQGFHNLGLGLAFWHSVPDATLPIFFWDTPDWHPLVRRV